MRVVALLLALAACALLPSAAAGASPLAPAEGDATGSSPLFALALLEGEVHARVDVATDPAMSAVVGSCAPAELPSGGSGCRLAQPLADGVYYWRAAVDTAFCDGDAGQFCEWQTTTVGPTAFTVATAPPPAAPARPTRLVVPGRSIGGVALGMDEAQVRAVAGGADPARSPAGRSAATLRRYRGAGGPLEATFRAGRVVAVATASRAYRTAGGVGVGSRAAALGGFRVCGGAAVAGGRGARTTLALRGGAVVSLRVERAASATLPACASTSSP